jgi:hypothetical protein
MQASPDGLCYLNASRVLGPTGRLAALTVRTRHNEPLGSVDGVLIDPLARTLCYYVVETRNFEHRRYLLPADAPATVDCERNALRVEMEADDLYGLEEFDTRRVREFTDEDAIAPTLRRYLS